MADICQCPKPHKYGSYTDDDLIAMPIADFKWEIIHEDCCKPADDDLPTED